MKENIKSHTFLWVFLTLKKSFTFSCILFIFDYKLIIYDKKVYYGTNCKNIY